MGYVSLEEGEDRCRTSFSSDTQIVWDLLSICSRFFTREGTECWVKNHSEAFQEANSPKGVGPKANSLRGGDARDSTAHRNRTVHTAQNSAHSTVLHRLAIVQLDEASFLQLKGNHPERPLCRISIQEGSGLVREDTQSRPHKTAQEPLLGAQTLPGSD